MHLLLVVLLFHLLLSSVVLLSFSLLLLLRSHSLYSAALNLLPWSYIWHHVLFRMSSALVWVLAVVARRLMILHHLIMVSIITSVLSPWSFSDEFSFMLFFNHNVWTTALLAILFSVIRCLILLCSYTWLSICLLHHVGITSLLNTFISIIHCHIRVTCIISLDFSALFLFSCVKVGIASFQNAIVIIGIRCFVTGLCMTYFLKNASWRTSLRTQVW